MDKKTSNHWLPSLLLKSPGEAGSHPSSRLLSIKLSLIIGYGTVLFLLLLTGYMTVRKLEEVRGKTDLISNDYALSVQLLSQMAMDVSLISLAVVDQLHNADPGSVGDYEAPLREIKRRIDRTEKAYLPLVTLPGEKESWPELQREIEDFWKAVGEVLALHKEGQSGEITNRLSRLIAQKEHLFKTAERLISFNRDEAVQEERRLARIYSDFRKTVLVITWACLILGVLVALAASKQIVSLQKEVLRQYRKDLESQARLQNLSAQLVTMQEEERKAISRELHDEVGQMLTAIKVNLRAIEKKLPPEETGLHERLEETRVFTDQTLQSVRELCQILRPTTLDDFGLVSTMQWYIDKFCKRTGIDVQFTALGIDERLSGTVETHLYRIMQEALANIAKHAEAGRVRVSLRRVQSTLELSIDDNGKGFEVNGPPEGGYNEGLGLVGMRGRIAQLGGAFRIDSRPGCGTHVYIEVPIARNGADARAEDST